MDPVLFKIERIAEDLAEVYTVGEPSDISYAIAQAMEQNADVAAIIINATLEYCEKKKLDLPGLYSHYKKMTT